MTDTSKAFPTFLIDTNVMLDYYLPDRTGNEQASRFIQQAHLHNATLAFSVGAAKDFFYIYCNLQKRYYRQSGIEVTPATAAAIQEIAWGCLANMADIAQPVPIDIGAWWLALKSKRLCSDFEDGLLLATCGIGNIDYLVTTDKRLAAQAAAVKMGALTPEQAIAYLE